MARIKPSEREKKRYIVFEITSDEKFGFDEVKDTIFNACRHYIGEFGLARARIYVIQNTFSGNKGIFRVTNRSMNEIKEVLKQITSIKGRKAAVNIIGISGILKKAKNKFLFKK